MKRSLDKAHLRHDEDWYGNNAAVPCPLCGKVFIASTFVNKGQRECPNCHRSSAEITNEAMTIQWPDEQEIPTVYTRAELLAKNRMEEFILLVEEGGAVDPASIKAKPRVFWINGAKASQQLIQQQAMVHVFIRNSNRVF